MDKRVLIVQSCVPDYRVAFFNQLQERLGAAGVETKVVCGDVDASSGLVEGCHNVTNCERLTTVRVGSRACWISGAVNAAYRAEFVILNEGIRRLHNHAIIMLHGMGLIKRVAFWGHGGDFNKADRQPFLDSIRAFMDRRADWWFAYTELSRDSLLRHGVPDRRITVVNNSTDSLSLRRASSRMKPQDVADLKREIFGDKVAGVGGHIGCFCGRLTTAKWIPFLLESSRRIRQADPGFHLLVIGDGPERGRVEAFCRENPWCRWLGSIHGPDLGRYLSLADVWLNPGMTGLAVVDALALGIPFATTDNGIHSPEIAYLRPERNGLITKPDERIYAEEVAGLIKDEGRLERMKSLARKDGEKYTVEDMAERFALGIETWIREVTA